MERPERPTRAYLGEFAWAFLLVNVMAGGAGLLVGIHLDSIGMGLALFLGGSLTVTVLVALLIAGTMAKDALFRLLVRLWRRGVVARDEDGPHTPAC